MSKVTAFYMGVGSVWNLGEQAVAGATASA